MKRSYLVILAAIAAVSMCACSSPKPFAVSNLKGTYTLYANGSDSNSNPTSVVASLTLDGKGNVTGGEQDFDDAGAAPPVAENDTVSGGTITIDTDGRGTLTLDVAATSPSVLTTETFSIVQVNTKHLLVTEFDSSLSSSGSMDLQTSPAAAPVGGNSFAVADDWNAIAFGGVITSANGAVTGEGDDDETGSPNYDFPIQGAVVSMPDSYGRGTISMYDQTYNGNLQFAYYVVGPEAFRLIETDGPSSQGNTGYYMAGSMFGQGSAAGAFSPSSLKGSFAFTQSGPEAYFYEFGIAGEFTTDGSAAFSSGVVDENDADVAPSLAADISATSYTISTDGYGYATLPSYGGILQNFGVYMVDPAINIADPNSTKGGGGALMTDLDNYSLGIGFAVPQTAGATFTGNYAFNQDGAYVVPSGNTTVGGLFDMAGRIVSKSSNLTGTADYNDVDNSGLNPDVAVTGSFTADNANPGRATAQVSLNGSTPANNVTLYQANDDLILHVDTDWDTTNHVGTVATGVIEKQQ